MNIIISSFSKISKEKKNPPIVATTKQLIETRFAQSRSTSKGEVVTNNKKLKLRVWFKKQEDEDAYRENLGESGRLYRRAFTGEEKTINGTEDDYR